MFVSHSLGLHHLIYLGEPLGDSGGAVGGQRRLRRAGARLRLALPVALKS
jgi:hypothetical protein